MLAETEFSLIFEEQYKSKTSFAQTQCQKYPLSHSLLNRVVLKVLRCAIFKLLWGSHFSKLEACHRRRIRLCATLLDGLRLVIFLTPFPITATVFPGSCCFVSSYLFSLSSSFSPMSFSFSFLPFLFSPTILPLILPHLSCRATKERKVITAT